MIDTKLEVNGKTVGEYDLINEPCVKKVNGEGPDDNGNVAVEGGGPTINGGYDVETIKTISTVTTDLNTSPKWILEYGDVHDYFSSKLGEECSVLFDGTEYKSVITKDNNDHYHFGDSDFSEFPFHIYTLWNVEIHCYSGCIEVSDTSVSHTVEVIKPVLTPVVFADKYIPDTIARKDRVYSKDETYSGSQLYTKSETYSKNEIDQNFYAKDKVYTKDEVYTKHQTTLKLTWDGTRQGDLLETTKGVYQWYYKVSDEIIPFEDIIDGHTVTYNEASHAESTYENVKNGINCYSVGYAIIVLSPGDCGFDPGFVDFTAPSTGIYLKYSTGNNYVKTLEINYYDRYQTGLIVNSPTKKFKITVDDSGTISATEITA